MKKSDSTILEIIKILCLCVCVFTFLIRYLRNTVKLKHSDDYRKQVDQKNKIENSKTPVYLESVITGLTVITPFQ